MTDLRGRRASYATRLENGSRLAVAIVALGACDTEPANSGVASVRFALVGDGWAQSSVNAAVFRQNSVTTHGDTQYTAYYDAHGYVMLAKRRLGTHEWDVRRTEYTGNVRDAHNAICIAVDGDGVLHIAWDHHGQPLQYARGVRPGALELTQRMAMTGEQEDAVTYPQFYNLRGGDLLFLYRDGGSGRGNVMLNRYDLERGEWHAVQHPLIDGEGKRNAYVNTLAVDGRGGWHLSWTWRETPDVATNHDIAYAFSPDEGRTWRMSTGEVYALPITVETAELAARIPQHSELINQTTMAVDAAGRPLIASYWRPEAADVPQFHLVWHDGSRWRTSRVGDRQLAFRLSGGGTKRIPVSRPLVVARDDGSVYFIFRDDERGGGVSVAVSSDPDRTDWHIQDLDRASVGQWEPTHDPVLWNREQRLHLFHQRVGQGDAETLEAMAPQPVSILEWDLGDLGRDAVP